jgi:hypothetical protein
LSVIHLTKGSEIRSVDPLGFSSERMQAMAGRASFIVWIADREKVKYRALVTDINLGHDKLIGWDVARRAREIDAGFPGVDMTGAHSDDWASRGVPNSVLLSKPFAQAQLLTAASQLLNADRQTA